MIEIRLDDPKLIENIKAVQEIRKYGYFSDEEIQKMYDDQVKQDKAEAERDIIEEV